MFKIALAIFVCLTLLTGSNGGIVANVKSEASVKHGDSYTIQSVLDESFLTSTSHTPRPNYGVYVGKVLTSEFHGTPNQIWDTIRWPDTPDNQFWLYPKAATLNEVTAIPDTDAAIPPKNHIEFIPVTNRPVVSTGNRTYDDIQNSRKPFLLKSIPLNSCVENRGVDHQISYKPCNPSLPAQNWLLEYFYEDRAEFRGKAKFYCKFHTG